MKRLLLLLSMIVCFSLYSCDKSDEEVNFKCKYSNESISERNASIDKAINILFPVLVKSYEMFYKSGTIISDPELSNYLEQKNRLKIP